LHEIVAKITLTAHDFNNKDVIASKELRKLLQKPALKAENN